MNVVKICLVFAAMAAVVQLRYSHKLNSIPRAKLYEIKDQLKTGDLILCSAYLNQVNPYNLKYLSLPTCLCISIFKGWLYTFFNTIWSHAGVVVKVDGEVYVYETSENDMPKWDLLSMKTKRNGSRLISLEEKLKDYSGEIAIRPLNKPLRSDKVPNLEILPFKINYDLGKLLFNYKRPRKYDGSYQMCSELIYNFYIKAGVVKSDLNPKYVLPHHFESDRVKLQNGYCYQDPVIIKL